ncbi:SPOSA6832_01780 [Sporobolomyces salmonicolor]|uniref:SPOSA6832_01780-mRNA-1:cds n=1 Tax=Sporidiobolus salmonicolor TaxID=5005 RepID=A0A0D6EKP5_SPOSA|nr:SPOSA6832_01780 [Sporobolomyces salmonicolor]
MSYNGIGLSTPRGSGTSGHIQANRSHLRARQQFDKPADFKESFSHRAPDQAILDHERRRRVEAKCFELQVSLEDDGVEAEEVERQVGELRERLLAQSAGAKGTDREGAIKPSERHELAQAKELANEKLRTALGIKADHVEGLAFDKTAQAEIKRQKAEERERAREERAKIEAQLKVDREKALQAREAQRKKHEEDLARQRRKHEDELARDHREHEARMGEDRRRMDDELAARRRGAPPTAGARGGESTSLPYGDVPLPLEVAPPLSLVRLEVEVAEQEPLAAAQESEARQP